MKKPYQTPRMYAESFELIEHIASCSANPDHTTVNYQDKNTCSYQDADVNLFLQNTTKKCEVWDNPDPEMYTSFEEYLSTLSCYNAFSDGNFFAS